MKKAWVLCRLLSLVGLLSSLQNHLVAATEKDELEALSSPLMMEWKTKEKAAGEQIRERQRFSENDVPPTREVAEKEERMDSLCDNFSQKVKS